MARTVSVQITDAAIKRHAVEVGVRELNDTRSPLRLRYRSDRQRATWFLLQSRHGKKTWHKVGNWPDITAKALRLRLPGMLADLAASATASTRVSGWETVGELLNWYGDRMANDRTLSEGRRFTVTSAIRCHLLPCFAELRLEDLNHRAVDGLFWRRLQARYKLSTVKAWFAILKRATRLATKLQLIERDPLAAVTFGNFTTASVQPKAGKLRPSQVKALLKTTPPEAAHRETALFLLLLMCGTRIGETRRTAWSHIDAGGWYIPPEHAKNRTEHYLPMTEPLQRVLMWWRAQSQGSALFPEGAGTLSASTASALIRGISRREWTAHDLRKLARTCWADLGVDYMVGELLLNHTLSKLDQTYIHTHAEAQKLAALTQYHQWLMDNGLAELLKRLESKTEGRQPILSDSPEGTIHAA